MQILTHIVFFCNRIEQSNWMEGLHKPDSHALNASGLLGFGFKSRKKKKKMQ